MKQSVLILFLVVSSFFFPHPVFSQDNSNKGTDFWLGYMAHIDSTGSNMSLYITSDVNTSGTVSVPLQGWSLPFTVVANTTTVITIPPNTAYVNCSDCILGRGIHVTSLLPIVVYAHIYHNARSDATLVLPVPTLGKEYYTMEFTQNSTGGNRYSEFLIAAVEDSTQVQINPKQMTVGGHPANVPFTVTLMQGEVYQVQSVNDLTGSQVLTISPNNSPCKKVAVFSGSTFDALGCGSASSGDNLFQQLYPINAWGNNFITAPFKTRIGGDYFRILAATNGTSVTINGGAPFVMNSTQYYDTLSAVANYITASSPVTLAQYQRTQNCDNVTGDPSMTILSPVEQTLDTITLYSSPFQNITGEYINVIMKAADTTSFRLDGSPVPFSVVGNNPVYAYSQNTVASGNHTLLADSGFNAIAYGFGNVESYGYNAGANVRNLDQFISASSNGIGNSHITCLGSTVNFTGVASYVPVSWLWYFGDGDTSSSQSPSHNYAGTGSYTVSLVTTRAIANNCDAQDSSSYAISIVPFPVADFTFSNTCLSDSVHFHDATTVSGSSITTWKWYFGDGDSSSLQNPYHHYAFAGTYVDTFVVKSNGGCMDTVTHSVVINPLPVANAGLDASICLGHSATLGASGGTNYLWSPSTTLSADNISNPVANPGTNTTYSVLVTDGNNCSGSDTVIVAVNPLPSADAGSDVSICPGTNTTLNASGGTSYLWSPTTNLSSSTVSNPVANPSATLHYSVTVTDANGCFATDTMTVTLYPLPAISQNVTICFGDTTTLHAAGGNSYSWIPTSGLSASTIPDPIASPPASTTYTVSVTDGFSCTNDLQVNVHVNLLPPVSAGSDVSFCPGDSATLNASGALTYLWSPTAGLSSSTIADPVTHPASTQAYIVTGTDANTCHQNDTVTVTVFSLPSADAGPDVSICPGTNTTLNATGGTNYLWSPTASLSSAVIANPVADPSITTHYSVRVTDANTCVAFDTVMVSLYPLPTISPDATICFGDTTTLSVSGGVAFSWSPTTGLSSATVSSPVASPPASTTYTVSITDVFSCVNDLQVHVHVNLLPPVSAGSDVSFCPGDSATLNASGALSYAWSPTTGLSAPDISNPVTHPLATQTYIVTGTDINSCHKNDTVEVTVYSLPPADAGSDGTICIGDTTDLLATGGTGYLWSPANGLSATNIPDPHASPGDTTVYTVLVTDVHGCSKSDSALVIVNPLPLANAGPDLWVCPGASIQLSATGGVIYSWSPTASLDDPTSSNPNSLSAATTTFVVTVTDNNTCVKNDTVILVVNPSVPVNAGSDIAVCYLDSVQIGGAPTAPPGSFYGWTPTTGMSDSTVSNPYVSPALLATYIVYVTNDTCHGHDTIVVSVNPLPSPVDAGNDTTICFGVSRMIGTDSISGNSYLWTSVPSGFNATIAEPVVTPSDTLMYVLQQTIVATGCRNKDSVTISVNPLPVINAGTDTVICFGQVASIGSDSVPGNIYQWTSSPPGFSLDSSRTIVSPPADIIYILNQTIAVTTCTTSDSVTVLVNPLPLIHAGTDTVICFGQAVTIGADSIPGNSYSWSSVPSGYNSVIADSSIIPSDTTTYFLVQTIVATGCSLLDSIKISVNPLPVIDAGTDTSVCFGGWKFLGSDSLPGLNYVWSSLPPGFSSTIYDPYVRPDSSTVYYLLGINTVTGCTRLDSASMIVFQLPHLSVSGDSVLCSGETVSLHASGGASYFWMPSAGLDSVNSSSVHANPDSTITYFITVTDTNGCRIRDSLLLTVYPAAIANAGQDITICKGTTTTLNGSGGIHYLWSTTTGIPVDSFPATSVSPFTDTDYILEVTDPNGCRQKDTVHVGVDNLLHVAFTADSLTGGNQLIVNFANTSVGASEFTWTFGDGAVDTIPNPRHFYADTGTYRVVLIGISSYGCRDTSVLEFIRVERNISMLIPNVFSPNGDGVNDKFFVPSEGFTDLKAQIFNRWGVLVADLDFAQGGWDGKTTSGNQVSPGTYYYIINATDVNGKLNQVKGFVEVFW